MSANWASAATILGFIGLALAGCGDLLGTPTDPLDSTAWVLVTMGEQDALSGTELTAAFSGGLVEGWSGCNSFSGSYRVRGDRIEIRDIQSTLRACMVPAGSIDQEQEFLRRLANSESYQLMDGQLQLVGADGVLLAFLLQD